MKTVAQRLDRLLQDYLTRRVIVVGTTCTGKSTLIPQVTDALDMDELLFPQLNDQERAYVCQKPWTKRIGNEVKRLARKNITVEPGHPLFGTVVLDCDFIVYLDITDLLLRERVRARGKEYLDAKNMQRHLQDEIRRSGIDYIEFPVG